MAGGSEAAGSPEPDDERRHDPPDTEGPWLEAWSLDFVHGEGMLAGAFELLHDPAEGVAGFHAAVVGRRRALITLGEPDSAPPAPPGLELRAPGLWAEVGIQTPLEHVTVDIEAFAVELDDPDDVFGRAYGRRVALGSELEWETVDVFPSAIDHAGGGYAVACRVHGELLVDTDAFEIDGWGWRSHRWGRSIDPAGHVRGRGADGGWWYEPVESADGLDVIGRAPIAHRVGRHASPLEQQLVTSRDRIGWARRPITE